MTRLAFLDTETTSLEPDAHIWDFAAILRDPGKPDREVQFFVQHDYSRAATLPEPFLSDYRDRYDPAVAVQISDLVQVVAEITHGATIIGAVPNFDTERLAKPMRALGREPTWHYHLCDVENLVVGYVLGQVARLDGVLTRAERELLRRAVEPPWDSDVLSRLVGVQPPAQGEGRHTALGDCRWSRDVFNAVAEGRHVRWNSGSL